MTERWRRALGRLDREEPDELALRARAEEGPRLPEPSSSTGSRLVAAALALLLALAGTTLAVRAFRSDGSGSGAGVIDPAAVCGLTPHHGPGYVSLDGLEVPRSLLDETGTHYSELPADVVGDLRSFITRWGLDVAHPPEDGWRIIEQGAAGATVAAPNGHDWYVIRIDGSRTPPKVGGWAPNAAVLPTAADRGAGLRLAWNGSTEVQQGEQAEMHLEAMNEGAIAWKDDRGEYWGIAHVFDPATGRELFPDAEFGIAGVGREYDVPPGGRFDVPVATPPRLDSLPAGTYELVACVPELSLASPVGELHVVGDASAAPSTSESSVSNPLGYAFIMPDSWSAQDIDAYGRTTTRGTVVSSVPLPKPSGSEILPDLSALPPGEVVLAILHTEGGPYRPAGDDTPLPLDWEDFEMIPNDAGFTASQSFSLGGRTYDILFGGTGDGVTVHGDDLRAIVASIRLTSG